MSPYVTLPFSHIFQALIFEFCVSLTHTHFPPYVKLPILAISLYLTGIVGSQGAHGRRLLAAAGGIRGGLELLEDARNSHINRFGD